jgi:hypothetical protein
VINRASPPERRLSASLWSFRGEMRESLVGVSDERVSG